MLLEQHVCRHAPVFQPLALRLGWCDRTVFLLRSAPFRSATTARAWSKHWRALKTAPSWWTACTAWAQPSCWAWARSRRAAMPSRPSSRSPVTKARERSWGSLRWDSAEKSRVSPHEQHRVVTDLKLLSFVSHLRRESIPSWPATNTAAVCWRPCGAAPPSVRGRALQSSWVS